MGKLNPGFMAEIFKLMFSDEVIMRIASEHLKYELIPKEWSGYKFILREAVDQYREKGKLPAWCYLSKNFLIMTLCWMLQRK